MDLFMALLTLFLSLARFVVMLIYPLYASVLTIERTSKGEDVQWLTYWILYSFLTLTEMVFEAVLAQIPIWYEVKLVLVAWLVLPQFRGAALIYERFVREPLRKSNEFGVVEKDNLTNNNIKNKNSDFITPIKGQEKQEAY